MKVVFTLVCGICLLLLSMIRSGPVYGKLDFILVDSRGWWHQMQPMIREVLREDPLPIYTDCITAFLLEQCFGQPIAPAAKKSFFLNVVRMDHANRSFAKRTLPQGVYALLMLPEMAIKKNAAAGQGSSFELPVLEIPTEGQFVGNRIHSPPKPYRCVINLTGFESTWVPRETGHWSPYSSVTYWYYYWYDDFYEDGNDKKGLVNEQLIAYLKENLPENCLVAF